MNFDKIYVNVPKEIEHISNWKTIDTNMFIGHSIINKSITGCGFTTYCLVSNIPTILCSPRKFLIKTKSKDFPKVHVITNNGEKEGKFEIDLENINPKEKEEESTENIVEINKLQGELFQYLQGCKNTGETPKIMVTYDSFKYISSVLDHFYLRDEFSVIIDEFQNIFVDSRFKADTELSFISYLQGYPNVSYLSATPHIDEYLFEVPEFRNLRYYEFQWDPCRIRKPHIEKRKISSPYKEIEKWITRYRSGSFPIKIINNKTYYSKEVVFYVNSVKMITSIITKNNLTPEECNIICSDSQKNIDKLKKLGFTIGEAPKEGKPHKMFTICTRTVYAGSDFYHPSAYTVVVSDCNIDSLSVDIRLDLPQIMGRQRLESNVFRDEALLLYKLSDKEVTMEKYYEMEKRKMEYTNANLESIEKLLSVNKDNSTDILDFQVTNIRLRVSQKRYKTDYIGIDELLGLPKVNVFVKLCERRAFELRSSVYCDDFALYNELISQDLDTNFSNLPEEYKPDEEYKMFLVRFNNESFFTNKMKILCDFIDSLDKHNYSYDIQKLGIDMQYRNYLSQLSIPKIKALKYQQSELDNYLKDLNGKNTLVSIIQKTFLVDHKYLCSDIKKTLQQIYDDNGITKIIAKATDLEKWFEVKSIRCYDSDKKQQKRYKILKIK